MITIETYKDLKSILDDVAGVAWDNKDDAEYIQAIMLIVYHYELHLEQTSDAAQYKEYGENI